MSIADMIILSVVVLMMGIIIYRMVNKKDETKCARCSYSKK